MAEVDEKIAAELVGGVPLPSDAARHVHVRPPPPARRVPPVQAACDPSIPVPDLAVKRVKKKLGRYLPGARNPT
jgi:hypothetical protein